MIKQNLNTSEVRADQAASNQPQTLKLGLDVHAETIVVVRILDNSAPPPAQKFTPVKFLAWIKTQLPLAVQVHSCARPRAQQLAPFKPRNISQPPVHPTLLRPGRPHSANAEIPFRRSGLISDSE